MAAFLMLYLFTVLAEDVGLLPTGCFTRLLEEERGHPDLVPLMLEGLWDTMKTGGFSQFLRTKILRFNGSLFADRRAVPMAPEQLGLLAQAARGDWKHVEPAIFGVFLERALDPRERRALGAHFTPRTHTGRKGAVLPHLDPFPRNLLPSGCPPNPLVTEMNARPTPKALSLILLLALLGGACAAPERRAPPPEAVPHIGVELEGRVFVPARLPPEAIPAERPAEPAPEPLAAEETPREVPAPAAPVPTPADLVEEGRFAEALESLDEAGEEPTPEAWRLRAQALAGLGRRSEAVWAYAEVVAVSDEIAAEDARAQARGLLDALDEGELAEVAAACPLCPEGGYARLRRARLLHAAGEGEEAEEVLARLGTDFAGDPLGSVAEGLLAQWIAVRSVVPGLYGLILPLSGPLQPIGERALRGALVASRLFDAGGDPGIRLLVANSRGEPEDAGRAVRELAARGVVGIAGPLKGSAAAEAARVARELGVPLVAPTPAPEAAGGGAFRLYLREEDEMVRLAEHAVAVAGLRQFAILYPDTPLGRRYRDLFWGEVVARGGEVTGVEAFAPGSRDQAEAIRRLTGVFGLTPAEVRERFVEQERERLVREQSLLVALGLATAPGAEPEVAVDPDRLSRYKPRPIVDFDAVFLPVSGVEAGQIAPQLPFYDVEGVTLLGIRTWNHPTLVQVGEEYVAGALFPAEFHPVFPEARDFAAAYQGEYGELPGVIEAYLSDAVRLLSGGAALLGPETRVGLRRRLESLWAAPGVTGPLTTHPGGDVAAQAKILTVRRGRIAPASP